ncbi:MAG: DEAD/DEAH box helicase, partial [Micrococcales bacterium]|nr:DEAD/DEAH box helicase [Micrococcales bacterium]
MNRLVAALGTAQDRQVSLVHSRLTPATTGVLASWPDWIDPAVAAAYHKMGITQPWQHQAQAMEAIEQGQHLVIATGTGSGKSLALWAPVLSDLAQPSPLGQISAVRDKSTALYLAPTKALGADQLSGLRQLLAAGDLSRVPVSSCDGDSNWAERDVAAGQALAVLTNPDFLHYSLLPRHQRWIRLLRSLRYVIVDELHAYRGLSGAHVGMVLRRLRRLAQHLGADPQFLFASATLAEPAAAAARMAGLSLDEVTAVTDDFAAAGTRTQLVWKPMNQGKDGSWRRTSANQAAAQLAAGLTDVGARSVVFVTSRFAAESVAGATRRLGNGPASNRVATYRGGYLASERRAIEAGLRDGSLLTVVATSALELGIDVAGLDAVITAGWPGTRVALTQQAGRAGRAGA